MKASLTNYRQSPRKVRLIANAVKGKNVHQAHAALDFMVKKGALPIQKLLKSAIANAEMKGFATENLIIEKIEVNKGLVMKRFMPRAMGVAHPIRKKMSHVTLSLAEGKVKVAQSKK